MPTNKLWIEHTERAAWDSVEALRERLSKAETRLQALAAGAERVPELLDALDSAKQKHAPDAPGYKDVVLELVAAIERLAAELAQAKLRQPTVVTFAPASRPALDSEDLDPRIRSRVDDDDLELSAFTEAMQRRSETREPARDLNRLLALAENKVDDLTELEGAALREAALELALLAAKISAASRGHG